jgi:D-glycero-alpha-D-manno-heptose-7-phosphate kinase
MVITRTPFRISFFGGGSDYPAYYRHYGGSVLSTTINKYCYITCRWLPPFFDYTFRLRYRLQEQVTEVDQIEHPSVRECLRFMQITRGLEMVHTSDIPAMSGIGSSSAFTVGFLHALYALKGQIITKRRLALEAIHVEQDLIGEAVGSQDQTAAAFGGLNRIDFGGLNGVCVQPLTLPPERVAQLQDSLLFCFTGFPRTAATLAARQIDETPRRLAELGRIRQQVDEAVSLLSDPARDLADFGRLMDEAWKLKRSLTNCITNPELDGIYEVAMKAGATGGKLCGAGGGGFFIFFVAPERRPRVEAALKSFLLVPFRFETLGSHVIFYSQEWD